MRLIIILVISFFFQSLTEMHSFGSLSYNSFMQKKEEIDKGHIPFDTSSPFKMTYLERFILSNDSTNIYPTFIEDGFYYINITTKEIQIPIRFNEAYPFFKNKALVKYDDKYAVINHKGEFLIEPRLCRPEFNINYLPYFTPFGNFCFDFVSGDKLPLEFYNPSFHGDPLENSILIDKQDNKYGIISYETNNWIIKPVYDSIYYCDEYNNILIASLNDKIGVKNLQEDVILSHEYDMVIGEYKDSEEFIYGLNESGYWYYFSSSEPKKIICKSPHKIDIFSENNTLSPKVIGIFKIGEKYNLLRKDGTILSENYDWLHRNGNIGKKDNRFYLILDDSTEIFYYNGKKN